MKPDKKIALLFLVLLIPVGLATKAYTGPLGQWVNHSLGGIIYVIFWSLFLYLLYSKGHPLIIAGIIFLITCILEFAQLWHPAWLEQLRQSFLGRAMLGTSFSWLDYVHYLIGFVISAGLMTVLKQVRQKHSE
ncbi:MAG: DUF2809 domain-containing protein [candidate division KSB1 bacterium]|nr:DUF2809 domain-containing protein [candidate division KSB1 bacterium]